MILYLRLVTCGWIFIYCLINYYLISPWLFYLACLMYTNKKGMAIVAIKAVKYIALHYLV